MLRGISPTEETSVDRGRDHDSSVRVTIAGVVVGLGYAWVAADVRTFTRPAEVLTGVPIVVVAVLLVRGRRKGRRPTNRRSARWLAAWAGLALALFAWEMRELFASPRHDYPTMSSIGDAVLRSSRGVHALVFALWLAAGFYLARHARALEGA